MPGSQRHYNRQRVLIFKGLKQQPKNIRMSLLVFEVHQAGTLNIWPLYIYFWAGTPVDRPSELMVTQEVPHISRCLEETHSLDEFRTSYKEVLNTSNM